MIKVPETSKFKTVRMTKQVEHLLGQHIEERKFLKQALENTADDPRYADPLGKRLEANRLAINSLRRTLRVRKIPMYQEEV